MSKDLRIYRAFNKELQKLSDNELIHHFHTLGIKEDRIYNIDSFNKKYNKKLTSIETILNYYYINLSKKKTIYLYSPAFDPMCGGIGVLHYLKNQLENYKVFNVQLLTFDSTDRQKVLCNKILISNVDIIIYPEGIKGNPMNAKNVIRFILLGLGIEMPIDFYKSWNKTDIIFQWLKWDKKIKLYNQLCIPFFNDNFKNLKLNRINNTCCLIKKGRIFHNIYNIKTDIIKNGYFIIDNLDNYNIIKTFNTYKYFYCYDPITAFIGYAIICGCIPIIKPIIGYTRNEYIENFFTSCKHSLKHGFAYGNTPDEIIFAKNTFSTGINEAKLLFDSEGVVYNFINILDKYYNNNVNAISTYDKLLTIQDVYYGISHEQAERDAKMKSEVGSPKRIGVLNSVGISHEQAERDAKMKSEVGSPKRIDKNIGAKLQDSYSSEVISSWPDGYCYE